MIPEWKVHSVEDFDFGCPNLCKEGPNKDDGPCLSRTQSHHHQPNTTNATTNQAEATAEARAKVEAVSSEATAIAKATAQPEEAEAETRSRYHSQATKEPKPFLIATTTITASLTGSLGLAASQAGMPSRCWKLFILHTLS